MSARSFGLRSTLGRFFTRSNAINNTAETVLDFKTFPEESLSKIITRSDKELGGFSTVNFGIENGVGHFHGNLNLDLPKDNPEVTRSGYAMFRTKDQRESWLSGDTYWDWSNMSSLVMRLKGDRRKYLVNIQANTPLITDLFQHRLFLNHPGQWETVVIPLNDFVMTNWGVIQDGSEVNKSEVKTIGIGLLDKQYGPYSLYIDWIKVMTGAEAEKEVERSRGKVPSIAAETKDKVEPQEELEHHEESALRSQKPDEPKDTII